jgi:hypothetical protein
MIFNLNVHFTRVSDLVGRDDLVVDPPVPMAAYRDGFGNWCTRIVAPKGRTRISADALVRDTGLPDVIAPEAQQIPLPDLPVDTLVFLLGSPVLRNRSAIRDGVESLWAGTNGMGPGSGNLRLRLPTRHVRLRARAHDPHGAGSFSRPDGRLP